MGGFGFEKIRFYKKNCLTLLVLFFNYRRLGGGCHWFKRKTAEERPMMRRFINSWKNRRYYYAEGGYIEEISKIIFINVICYASLIFKKWC